MHTFFSRCPFKFVLISFSGPSFCGTSGGCWTVLQAFRRVKPCWLCASTAAVTCCASFFPLTYPSTFVSFLFSCWSFCLSRLSSLFIYFLPFSFLDNHARLPGSLGRRNVLGGDRRQEDPGLRNRGCVHSPGMRGAVEQGGEQVYLPLPRLPIRRHRKGDVTGLSYRWAFFPEEVPYFFRAIVSNLTDFPFFFVSKYLRINYADIFALVKYFTKL